MAEQDFIKLYDAQIIGAARRSLLRGVKLKCFYRWASPWVHTVKRCKVYRIGEDQIIVTDGGGCGGYIPLSISGLAEIVKSAKRLPIVSEVKL